MKGSNFKKVLSVTLALAITAGVATPGLTVLAGDTLPYLGDSAKGENQPFQHGYRSEDLLDWSPETDPYAQLLRAQVPLQDRNEAFSATQANPNLSPDAENFTLAGDYGNAFFDSYPYTNEFSQYLFNFWQYTDYYGSWHGQPTEEVPESLYNAEGERNGTSNWEQRYFEFGMMNLPNPGYTNAAHKNGVLSLGCIFQPRAYQHYDILLTQDENGNFPYGEKLIEICKYYGFDGWFFNMEGRSISDENRELLGKLFTQMREAGLYVQWYTASSEFNATTAAFLTDAKQNDYDNATRRAHSVFLDYGWSGRADQSIATAKSFGLDALQSVFGGIEAGGNRWTNTFDKFLGTDGAMKLSIATLGTEFVHDGLDEDLGGGGMRREQDEYQWMTFERERLWWTGANNATGPNAGLSGDNVGTTKTSFKGISNYISERSVVDGDTFVTNFNTGHGLEYNVNGVQSTDKEWSNITLQDVLPTWQWWFDTTGSKLSAEFDYGTQYQRTLKGGSEGSFGFDLVGAYNGGSSLAVYGALDARNFMRLYKTSLTVKENSKMDVTFQKSSDDAAVMKLGVIFESDPDNVVELEIADTAAKSSGWVTSSVDLSAYAGETVAAFGLVFDGTSADYQMNIGEMKYTSGDAEKPEAPTGLTISKAYDTGELVVSWEKAPYDSVKQYNVYVERDGKDVFLGGTYDETFYIKDIYGTDAAVDIKLKAVSADGTESDVASVSYDYTKAVKDIEVTAEDGKLSVSWTGGQADVSVVTSYEKEPRTFTASGNGSAEVTVPTGKDANGARYTMTIKTADGVAATYEGRLDDSWSAPYTGEMRNMAFTNPLSKDWFKLHYWVNGAEDETGCYTRGVKNPGDLNNDWSDFKSLPSNTTSLKVVLEDYSGNLSEAVNYSFKDGQPIDLNKELSAQEIPDAVLLEAIKSQVGTTIGDVINYVGKLDLSGLGVSDLTGINLISGITELDLSGTQVSDLAPVQKLSSLKTLNASNTQIEKIEKGVLSTTLTSLDLSGNAKLVSIEEGAIAALTNLETLDITGNAALTVLYLDHTSFASIDLSGCTAVEKLYITGSKMEELDISGLTKLTHLYANDCALEKLQAADASAYENVYCMNFSGSKLDLSDGTPERAFMDAMDAYIQANPITPVQGDLANIALNSGAGGLFDGLVSSGNTTHINTGSSVVIDLGSQQTVKSWAVYAYSYAYYIPSGLKLEVSEDGVNYTPVGEEVTGNTNSHLEVALTEDQYATGRYFKLTVTQANYAYLYEIELYGNPIDPYGLDYSAQRPAAYLQELPEKLTVTTNKTATIRMKDYYEACYKDAETVRGTLFSTLEGADWIAADYDVAAQIAMPKNVYVQITDEAGNIINTPDAPETPEVDTETNVALGATVLGGSGENSYAGEGYAQLMDGDTATKWCTGGNSGWMAFTLPEEVSIGKWVTTHAEINNEPSSYNTEDFELQILNTEAAGMSEDEFLALSSAAQKTIMSNNDMWTTIDHVTGNKSMTVDRDVDGADEAKVYRLKVNKSINGTSNAAVRVHELELYAAENVARDYDGVLALDQVGLYQVDFMKGKNILSSMEVRVRPVTSVLETIIGKADQLIADGALENTMEAVVTEYNAALAEAKELVGKEDATQAEINASAVRLLSAMAKVDWKQGDKTALQVVVDIANTIKPDLDLYVEAGKQEFLDALSKAEAMLSSGNAWDDDIKAAATELIEAMSNLRMAVNKDILNSMIDKASATDLSVYTEASATAVRAALGNAEALAADENATQEAVDAAANSLKAALDGLTYKSTDTDAGNGGSGSSENTMGVGDGSTPTKTGDLGVAGLAALAVLSAAGVLFLRKKKQ